MIFFSAKQEVNKEQEPGTELISAELKSITFTPTFPLFFRTTEVFAAPGLL